MSPASAVIVAVSAVVVMELFLRLPFFDCAKTMLSYARKATATVTSAKISDHWKEKVLLRYACLLAGLTAKLAAMFLIIVLSVLALAWLGDSLLPSAAPSLSALASWKGLLLATLAAGLYWQLRRNFVR